MYRAVVLTTLVILLLGVAGVSVAQDGRILAGKPNSDDPPGESTEVTTPEPTSLEPTSLEATGPEGTTTSPTPGASSEGEDPQNSPEPTFVTEPTVGEPEKPTAAPAREVTPTPATNDAANPGGSGRAVGKPELVVRTPDPAAGSAERGQHGNAEPVVRGNEAEPGRGVGGQKEILCHKSKTLTVGAPALAAHLRHGDTPGACQGGVPGPEPSGETVRPEAATNGEGGGGGQDKVVLCHKGKKTLTVAAQAQAAHLRHGDSPGACP